MKPIFAKVYPVFCDNSTYCCSGTFPFPISVFDGAQQRRGMETGYYLWCTFTKTTWRKIHRSSRLLWQSKSDFAML